MKKQLKKKSNAATIPLDKEGLPKAISRRVKQQAYNVSSVKGPSVKGNTWQEIDKIEISEDEIIPLTEKEELFCLAFVKHRSATKAAREAGYANPEVQGNSIKRRPLIRLRIAQLWEEVKKRYILDRDDVLEELSKIATTDITEFADIAPDGEVTMKPEFDGRMVKSISSTVDKFGNRNVKLEFWNKDKALENLGRFHKLFEDTIDNGDSSKVQRVKIGDMVVEF